MGVFLRVGEKKEEKVHGSALKQLTVVALKLFLLYSTNKRCSVV